MPHNVSYFTFLSKVCIKRKEKNKQWYQQEVDIIADYYNDIF